MLCRMWSLMRFGRRRSSNSAFASLSYMSSLDENSSFASSSSLNTSAASETHADCWPILHVLLTWEITWMAFLCSAFVVVDRLTHERLDRDACDCLRRVFAFRKQVQFQIHRPLQYLQQRKIEIIGNDLRQNLNKICYLSHINLANSQSFITKDGSIFIFLPSLEQNLKRIVPSFQKMWIL